MKQTVALICLSLFTKLGLCYIVPPPNKDFVLVNNQVWVLQGTTIKVFDLETGQQIYKNLKAEPAISTIAKDNNDNIVVDQGRDIKALDVNTLQWRTIGSYDKALLLLNIFFNQQNECYLVTDIGVVSLKTGKSWFPGADAVLNMRSTIIKRWNLPGEEPQSLIDKNDNIWIYYDHGEWGGDIYVFNTKLKHFIKPVGDFICGDLFTAKRDVYCLGPSDYGRTICGYGAFSRFTITNNNNADYKIAGNEIYNTADNPLHKELEKKYGVFSDGDYIGHAAYNPADNKIYFFCDFGLYKGDPVKSLKTIDCWNKVDSFHLQPNNVKPRLHDYQSLNSSDTTQKTDFQEDYDTTMPYAMWKMDFTNDGKLVFITYHDGLGVFDGKKIIILDPSSSF